MKKEQPPKGNVYKVNLDDFTTPDGRYFDFDLLSEAVDSGKLKLYNKEEDTDDDRIREHS